MNMNKGGGPAFPAPDFSLPNTNHPGMSLRDYFAGKALERIAVPGADMKDGQTNDRIKLLLSAVASLSYAYADAMLEARKK